MPIRGLPGLAIAFALVGSACSASVADLLTPRSPHPKQALLDELEHNVGIWNATGITEYAFTYRPVCFCRMGFGPHLVVAEAGGIRIDGAPVDAGGPLLDGAPAGVAGLFALVRRAIDGDRLTVTYDPATGVPLAMDSDPIANAVDDELRYAITDWTLDPPDDALLGEVTEMRALWDRQQIGNYTMTVRITCANCALGGRIYTTTAREGEIVVTSGGEQVELDDPGLEGIPLRVESLFETAALAATIPGSRLDFDPQRGYPTRIETPPDPTGQASDSTSEVISFTTP